MKRFDNSTLEGNETRYNHGDSERVRLREEEPMTDLEKAERLAKWLEAGMEAEGRGPVTQLVFAKHQATLIRSLISEVEELRKAKEALDWLFSGNRSYTFQSEIRYQASMSDAPPYLKSLLEKERNA